MPTDGDVLVGIETGDDSGVYRVADGLALVQTVDFITPVVDDPYLFGQIAAANSLSDVYAMGGEVLTAMNVLCVPIKGLERLRWTAENRRRGELRHVSLRVI